MKNKRANIKTTKQEIIDYWIEFEDECDLNFDWSEANIICWRCGCKRRLQRCHIIPYSLGGKDEPSNFVLLCNECHIEAPNVESSTFMWDWIKSYHNPFYDTFWQNRAFEEYERIYHKNFFEELEQRNIRTEHALSAFWKLHTGRTSYHFGHPYGNVSTITGNYKLHLDAFDAKYPNGKYLSDEKIEDEMDFELFTNSFCELATKYNFSVWEGGTKNPYSLCMSSYFPSVNSTFGISIKKKKGNYFLYISNDYNPNHISARSFNINLNNNHKEILCRIENEIKKLIEINGLPMERTPYYFVSNSFWRKKH